MFKIEIPILGEREMMPTSSVTMNEGRFIMIISMFNSQNNWGKGGGGVYDHLTSTRIFTLIVKKIII